MTEVIQETMRNRLLRAMGPEVWTRLRTELEPMLLPRGLVVSEPMTPSEWIVFPESGVVSVVGRTATGRRMELGVFGLDGMGNSAFVLGVDRTPNEIMVQVPGHGHRISAAALMQVVGENAALQSLLLRYVHVFMLQVSQTALANGIYTIEERLSRWLLLVHDRMDGDELSLTHEFLAIMLGVRRTGVTLAVHMLEGNHLIRARRGVITVLDRAKLVASAAGGYGAAEAEYERLLGPMQAPLVTAA